MIKPLVHKVFGTKNERELKRLQPIVARVNDLESKFEKYSDQQLLSQTAEFKSQIEQGESLDNLLPQAFAVVREASKRTLGMRHFDVQVLGGAVLHEGKIAEMKTGEGKTLCATLPVYLNALTGKGVHVVTVNDYLARRDAEWMDAIYSFLGLSTGVVVQGMGSRARKESYLADITYGQNNEFGFDLLRDNMKLELDEMVQRPHYYAIVDEVDSILVDEARTPLIISGPSEKPTERYLQANKLVPHLKEDEHFTVETKSKQILLTDDGVQKLEELLQVENLYDPQNIEMLHHANQALKAHITMKRDFDYVVRGGEVIIVDEFTGRLMSGRRWSDGLHQAVEAKEGVNIKEENQTLATITFQNYFRMYEKLAGMTGTADTEAVEFKKIYNLDVIVVPTNKPMIRKDHADVVYASEPGKYQAVCDEIQELNEKGQPILVGTASIAKSELLGSLLKKRGVPHHVLNAKHHEREADIVAQAGRIGAITISTNMAGRGTDILLGGNPEFLAAEAAGTKDQEDPEFQNQLEHFSKVCAQEKQEVLDSGGLHILGTERHESRRIDNQLRGRAGRQGDPGSSRFYVSLEDDLMKRFGGERIQAIMTRFGLREDDAVEGGVVNRAIENAQKKVEGYHFDIRKHLLDYDNVMSRQREVIYSLRKKILRDEGTEEEILEMVPDTVESIILARANDKEPVRQWDIEGMFAEFRQQFGIDFNAKPYFEQIDSADSKIAQEIFDDIKEQALARLEERKQRIGVERFATLERIIFLQAIDYYWKEHLTAMDHLREGINLRSYGQKNPLHEYQREGFELFSAFMQTIKSSVLQHLFLMEIPSDEELRKLEEQEKEMQRKREQAAQTIHEEVDDLEAQDKSADAEGLNRKQRRRAQKVGNYQSTSSDYTPPPVAESSSTQSRKAAQRKKNKAARKARKKRR